jgi:DNA-binding CsgD family transcriptional regulator
MDFQHMTSRSSVVHHGCSEDGTPPEIPDQVFSVVERLTRGGSAPEIGAISLELRQILPHKFLACASIRAYDGSVLRILSVDCAEQFLDAIEFRQGSSSCAMLREWFNSRSPVMIRDATQLLPLEKPHLWRSWPSLQGALAVHAQLDSTGNRGLAFCFGGIPPEAQARCERILRFLTPYLFSAVARTFWTRGSTINVRPLTTREIEVIEWMYYGKTNEEIAALLNISVYTVKNHVQKILLKLSASNRTQAVLRAAEAGIVRYSDSVHRQPHS